MKKYNKSLFLLVILAVIALLLILRQNSGTLQGSENTFAVDDTATITKFYLADRNNNSVKLVRIAGASWQLNDKYQVNPTTVQVMLQTFLNIDIKSPVSKASRNTIIRVMAGKSVKTEIYQRVYRINLFNKIKLFPHEKLTRAYFVGDATMDNSGTFMLMQGSEEPYIVNIPGFRGYVAARYSPYEADWRGHSLFKFRVPDISSVSVNYSETPGNSFLIKNIENQSFTLTSLADNRNIDHFDTLKVVQYLGLFRNLNFEQILDSMPQPKHDSIIAATPTIEIVLTDKLGKLHSLKAWKRKADLGQLDLDGNQAVWDLERMYAQPDNLDKLVTVQYFALGDAFVPIQAFLRASDHKEKK